MAEAVVEPKVEAKPEAVIEPKVESKVEAKPESVIEPAPKPEPKPEDWRDARIKELTFKLNEAKKAAPTAPVTTPVPGETPEVFEARVQSEAQARATQIAAVNEWNRQCDGVATAGKAEFKDEFDKRMTAIHSVFNHQDQGEWQQYNDVVAAAIEAGQAHKLLYALGENPGEFKRLMAANPAKRIVELTRMADRMNAPVGEDDPSGAPKPITPLGSKGLHYDGIRPDDPVNGTKLPKAEWFKQREKQIDDLRAAGVAMQ